jgi:hypothetical protein
VVGQVSRRVWSVGDEAGAGPAGRSASKLISRCAFRAIRGEVAAESVGEIGGIDVLARRNRLLPSWREGHAARREKISL